MAICRQHPWPLACRASTLPAELIPRESDRTMSKVLASIPTNAVSKPPKPHSIYHPAGFQCQATAGQGGVDSFTTVAPIQCRSKPGPVRRPTNCGTQFRGAACGTPVFGPERSITASSSPLPIVVAGPYVRRDLRAIWHFWKYLLPLATQWLTQLVYFSQFDNLTKRR